MDKDNVMYVYVHSETNQYGNWLYTVGFYSPDGKWNPESDHETQEGAAERVHYLNGGMNQRIPTYYTARN